MSHNVSISSDESNRSMGLFPLKGAAWLSRLQSWRSDIRSRVVIWYILLMLLSAAISVPLIHYILYLQLQERSEEYFNYELGEFRQVLKGRDHKTGRYLGSDVNAIFNSFLSRKINREDVFFLALVDGKLYKNTSENLSKIFIPDPDALERWGNLTKTETGELDTIEGPVYYYLAEPIDANGKKMVFAIIKDATVESEEINQEIAMVLEVTLGVLAIAALLTLLMARQILRPLHLLTQTARSISEPDLTQRIPVQGSDELAELTQTFNAMMDRLQTAFTSQKEFMNEIGHELRTPITIMRVHLELLGDDPQERRETVTLLTDELDRMSRLVNDLILLAKAEQPDFLHLEMVEVHAFTEELYAKAQALGDRHWQLELDGSGKVVCDRQRLTQAMMNLVLNATQQTAAGAQITVGSAVQGSNVHFWVRDTGPGIAPEAQPLIFDRFIRCPTARRRFEGMGLGLAIVRSIAEAHGGRVELSSQLDYGSTFIMVVPIDPPSG